MERIEKRGRPLGSGNKSRVVLGIRVSEEESQIIKEGLAKLKVKYKTNKKAILHLFEEYDKIQLEMIGRK
ncbi:hypothetical protein [Fusobacterium varium]